MNHADQKYHYLVLFLTGIFPFLINGAINPIISQIPVLYWSFELAIWVLMPCLIFYLLVTKHGLILKEIGFVNPFSSIKAGWAFIGSCLLLMFIDLFIYKQSFNFFYNVFPSGPIFSYHSIVPESGTKRILVVWYLAITAGVVEEFYFRGLLHKISQFFRNPNILYLVFSPLIFSAIHWEGNFRNMGATYIVGIFGCLFYLWLRNLWPLIVGHVYTDFIVFN